jgi:signal transduction histidine kinase
MKRVFLNLKSVIILAGLLFVIILFQSIFEYRSSKKATLELLNNQAGALIMSVARAGEKGLLAYEIQQRKITSQLYTVAEMIDRLDRNELAGKSELQNIISSNELALVELYDSRGKSTFSYSPDSNGIPLDLATIEKLGNSNESEIPLGFVDSKSRNHFYAIASRRSRGGAIEVGIGTAELLWLRKTLGAGSVIDDIGKSPGVRYSGIIKNGQIIAASTNFPKGQLDSWYQNDSTGLHIETRIKETAGSDGGKVFEAIGPFTFDSQLYGKIIIGMDTGKLDLIIAELGRDIFWRSTLFLILAVTAVGGFWVSQNYRLLTSQYIEIQNNVQQLERDKALSAKLVAMGELASGVAHEIRNPLNAIRVIIQRLQREFKPESDKAEYRELTDIMRKETDRINGTIEQFLSLARPPVLHKSSTDLNECILDTVRLFTPRAQAKNCPVETDLDNLPLLNLDKELIRQAILNLLENSLAAVSINGKIELKTYRDDDRCYLDVADNGQGIPDENKLRVFDLYFTTRPTGTGLGLPTVLRIVKEHGGRIDLSDRPAGGTLFKLEFPIEK